MTEWLRSLTPTQAVAMSVGCGLFFLIVVTPILCTLIFRHIDAFAVDPAPTEDELKKIREHEAFLRYTRPAKKLRGL